MKKIALILITLFAFIYANAQYTVPRGLPYHDTRWIENKGIAGASYLFDSIVMFRNIADTQMKPLYPAMGYLQNFDGDSTLWIWDMVRWKKLAGSGGGTGERFGIEDNLGIQDRSVDMQQFSLSINNASYYDLISKDVSGNLFSELYQDPISTQWSVADIWGTLSQAFLQLDNSADTINTKLSVEDSASAYTFTMNPRWARIIYDPVKSILDNNKTLEFPHPTGAYYFIPLTVNGVAADVTGAITIPIGGSGTVTSFSAGNLSPLFTSSVATSTTTPALTFSLTNATGGTVFGNNTGSSAAPAYTSVPVLGIAGTTKGTLGLAGNTSGVVTIQPAAAAGTWSLTLPTTGGTNLYFLQTDGSGNTTWAAPFTLTTTGTSGAATFSSGTLNIPNYASSGATLTATQIGFGDGSNLLSGSANLTYASSVENIFRNNIGTSITDALLLSNTQAAALGAQQYSPSLHFTAQVWKTTVASQTVDYRMQVVPLQGSSPTAYLNLQSQLNGGGYGGEFNFFMGTTTTTPTLAINTTTTNSAQLAIKSTAGGTAISLTSDNSDFATFIYNSGGGLQYNSSSTEGFIVNAPYLRLANGGYFSTSNNTGGATNLWANGAANISQSQFPSITPTGVNLVSTRMQSNGTTTAAVTANLGYGTFAIGKSAVTMASSGTHGLFANEIIQGLAITSGAGTLTDAATFYIEGIATGTGAPSATGVHNLSVWVDAGQSRFDGSILMGKGASVAAANDLTLGTDGNTFSITGATTINAITTTNWLAGSHIYLIFASNPTVKNNTSGGAGTAVMFLAGGVDFSATANDVLHLVYDGTEWVEVSRSVN